MKKFISFLLCVVCLVTCFTGCKGNKTQDKDKATERPKTSATVSASPSFSPSASDEINTALPEETPGEADPTVTPKPTPTPVPTPTPTIRPAQLDSIVPQELLTTGYTTPLDPASVKFPANYKMPYYIEVDVTNQCVNIFRKNTETGVYDILLNRFVCSGGTSTQPTKTGNFYIKTEEQQKASTGQSVKYTRYYFKKYTSYAYYVTRYSNEYMFHSFTFEPSKGKIVPKSGAYYNMGNTGSAGCLRMLMGHAKWIYENIDGGTYCVVNKNRAKDNALSAVLKKYVPPLGWDMTPAWNGDRNNYDGLYKCDFVHDPEDVNTNPVTPPPVTPTPEITPTPVITPTPTAEPTATAVIAPTQEPTPVLTPSPTPTPTPTPSMIPVVPVTPTPTAVPVVTPSLTPKITPIATAKTQMPDELQ